MKFSVVIPLYNKAPYIKAAIESVLAQTLADFEVIVIDDGSTDDGGDVAAEILDPRVHVIRQANAGVSAARNRGIDLARGEWVTFLDADDWEHPRYLATQWETIGSYAPVDAVATQYRTRPRCDELRIEPWKTRQTPLRTEVIGDLPARWSGKGGLFCTCSIAVRTSLLRTLQPCFPVGEAYGEDLDLWFRLNERSPIALTHAELIVYRVELPGSLSTTQAANIEEPPFLLRLERRVFDSSIPKHLHRSTRRFVDDSRAYLARRAIENNRRRDAVRLLWRARRSAYSPRWIVSAAMVILAPKRAVKAWQQWRLQRR